ncbi:hypothetical protein RF11_04688 [Thelohanellus kitauei]|uniref:Uncharacterized protein n=1 Tax=Thelohanellus kitauei TaxID=669202 RepID=A0A0C2JLH9_THEKT|nr:hypothetical protein RF11_04688 [Thelohanellus kitauei]
MLFLLNELKHKQLSIITGYCPSTITSIMQYFGKIVGSTRYFKDCSVRGRVNKDVNRQFKTVIKQITPKKSSICGHENRCITEETIDKIIFSERFMTESE